MGMDMIWMVWGVLWVFLEVFITEDPLESEMNTYWTRNLGFGQKRSA